MSHPHPYYDYKVGDQVAITTLAGPCIAFDEGLADFIHLVRTTTDKDLVITIPPKARLTPAFDRLVDATGCIVLVRESSGGYRDLRTGRWTPEIRPAASNRDDPRIVVSEAHFQQDDLTPLLTVSASIYHRARLSTVLGRVAELICAHFMPEGTVLSWARTEPAGAVWDRKTFTKTARDNMPEAHMILAAHGPGRSVASGSMTINRTENGLEEYLEMTVLPTHIEPAWWQDRVNTFLQAVGTELKPQFALVFRTEKLLADNGEQISDDVKAPVTEAVGKLKEALKGTDNDDEVRAAMDDLNQKASAMGQAMYQAAQAAAASAPSGESGGSSSDGGDNGGDGGDVVDAEIVDDDK